MARRAWLAADHLCSRREPCHAAQRGCMPGQCRAMRGGANTDAGGQWGSHSGPQEVSTWEAKRGHRRPCEVMRGHARSCEAARGQAEPWEPMRGRARPRGDRRGHAGPCGPVGGCMGGYVMPCQPRPRTVLPCKAARGCGSCACRQHGNFAIRHCLVGPRRWQSEH